MREEDVTHQNRHGVSPLGVERGPIPPSVGTIHDVVMHKACDVDEFDNDGEINVVRDNPPGSSSRKKGQRRTETLSAAANGVLDVVLHGRIDRLGLLQNPLLHRVEVGPDQFDRGGEGLVGSRINFFCRPSCEVFHHTTFAHWGTLVNVSGC